MNRVLTFGGVPVLLAGLLAALTVGTPAACGDDLDDALLKDLDNELLEGLDDIPLPDPPRPNDADDQPATQLQQNVDGEDIGTPAESPLARIGSRMRLVEQRIAQEDTSTETRDMQKRIVADLALLIEQMKQQCSNCKKSKPGGGAAKAGAGEGAKQASSRPAGDSEDRVGKSEAETARLEETKKMLDEVWGHLPPRLREQLQNSDGIRFLPKYERLIEQFYRRLSEEKR